MRGRASAARQMFAEAYLSQRAAERCQILLGAGAKKSRQRFKRPNETGESAWTRLSPPLIGKRVAREGQAQKRRMR